MLHARLGIGLHFDPVGLHPTGVLGALAGWGKAYHQSGLPRTPRRQERHAGLHKQTIVFLRPFLKFGFLRASS